MDNHSESAHLDRILKPENVSFLLLASMLCPSPDLSIADGHFKTGKARLDKKSMSLMGYLLVG